MAETPSDVGPQVTRPPIPLKGRKAKKDLVKRPATPTRLEPYTLTPMEAIFVREYLVDFDGAAALIRAGSTCKPGHSAQSAASMLLKKRSVALALNEALEKRLKRVDVKAEDVMREVARLAFADIRSILRWEGSTVTLKKSEDLSEDQAAAISEIKETDKGLHIKLHDKTAALTLLMKHMNLFPSTRIVADPQTGRVGMEVPGESGTDVVVLYQIPDNGRDPRPDALPAAAVNGHGPSG